MVHGEGVRSINLTNFVDGQQGGVLREDYVSAIHELMHTVNVIYYI